MRKEVGQLAVQRDYFTRFAVFDRQNVGNFMDLMSALEQHLLHARITQKNGLQLHSVYDANLDKQQMQQNKASQKHSHRN